MSDAPLTTKQAALLAWENATRSRTLSPLLLAIGGAIESVVDDDGSFKAAHQLGRFAQRIADSKEFSKVCALGYRQNWRGEWQVRNSDLKTMADFSMWLHRYCRDESPQPGAWTQAIAESLRRKRMQQAYSRYQQHGLRREHCLLAKAALWEIDTSRGDWISIFVQGKRPFGDSGKTAHIYHIAGWPRDWPEDDGPTDDNDEHAWNLMDEMPFALPDIAGHALALLEVKNRRIEF